MYWCAEYLSTPRPRRRRPETSRLSLQPQTLGERSTPAPFSSPNVLQFCVVLQSGKEATGLFSRNDVAESDVQWMEHIARQGW